LSLRRRNRFGIGGFSKRSFDLMPPEDLRNAIRSGDLAELESILKQHPDLGQSKDRRSGATLLHGAVFFNQSGTAIYLLEHGAAVDAGDRRGSTALVWAAARGNKEIVELLLSRGANANAKDQGGFNALYYAASSGHLELVKLLFRQGIDVDTRSNDGWTPLHSAAYRGHLPVAEWLVENGANVNATNCWGQTPLFWAAAGNDGTGAETPPKKSLNSADEMNAGKDEDSTRKKKLEVAKFLLARGADVNASDELGETPLYCAAYAGDLAVTKLLLGENAESNAKGKDGWTALCVAAKRGHTEVVKLLLDRGADANIKVKDIYSPFNYAVLNGSREIAELLLPTGTENTAPVKARCPECASQKQLPMSAPLFESGRQTRTLLRCTVCRAIWSKRKIEWRASGSGLIYLVLSTFYGIEAFHDRHGIAFFRIAVAVCWMTIGISHFTKSSKRPRTWIQGIPQSAATD
jgi:ankyrin repeat protein